jgi:hypothetical protein
MRIITALLGNKLSIVLIPTVLALCIAAHPAHAQQIGISNGTLSWSVMQTTGNCGTQGTFPLFRYSSFQFTYGSEVYPLSGITVWQGTSNLPGCPGPEPGPIYMSLSAFGSSCEVVFQSASNGGGSGSTTGCTFPSVSGYINPKYVVLNVYYVVPGSQSSSSYCNIATVGSTNQITNTLSSAFQNSLKVAVTGDILGFSKGSVTSTVSDKYTQSTSNSNSVVVTTSSQYCQKLPGIKDDYVPNNHDYDIIAVWVNPLVLLNMQQNPDGTVAFVQWNGYGFNTTDQAAMDVVQIYAGCLNGDFPTGPGTDCANNLAPLQRTWDTTTVWPAGGGPALTSQDLANILAADPFGMCTVSASVPPGSYPANNCSTSPDPSRFTITGTQGIQYQQPLSGGQPSTVQYTQGYTVSNTQSQSYTSGNSTTFGIETTFAGTPFDTGVSLTIGSSQTFATTTISNSSLATTNQTTLSTSITGPACVVSGNSCAPLYPSSADPGPTQFNVYEDTVYGTFLYYPVNWVN